VIALSYVKAWSKSEQAEESLRPDWYTFAYDVVPSLTQAPGLIHMICEPKEVKNQQLLKLNPHLVDQAGFSQILHFY
jgi:hypothetical protein